MEDRSGDTIQTMEEKPMSVAALASKFKQEQSNHLEKSEKHLKGPVRKKPPCFLHLDAPKNNTETGHNADEKPSVNDSTHRPKLKLKTSSPLIEKLQANLLLSPNALLLPGAAPKSPLKSCFSPFASPASTPDSPGARSQSSESDGVALDQPTEGEPLHSFHKSRARVSLKRRPPSRRFRHSAAEESSNPGSPETETPAKNVEPKENGAPGDENEDVFTEHGVQSNGENPKSPTSPKGDAHTSPKASSPEEPSHKELSSPQSQESEICPDPNQCEQIEDNDMATNKTDESPSEDSEATVSNDHHTAASETAGPETSNQEPKTEEVKVIETEQQISSTEEKSSGGTED